MSAKTTGEDDADKANDGEEEEGEKETAWSKKNPLWQQMKSDVANDVIGAEMNFNEAKRVREGYSKMEMNKFKQRLRSMRKIVEKALDKAADDAFDLFQDRLQHPRPSDNGHGEPEWVDHEAKRLLEIDMDAGKHKRMTPQALWETRMQYKDFRLATFRGHIYQEEHTRKWRKQWVDGKKEYAIVPPPGP